MALFARRWAWKRFRGRGGILPSQTIQAVQRAAEAAGEAVPQFITRAVDTQTQRDALARGLSEARHGD